MDILWCASGLGSFWSIDTCYELSLFFKLWTWLKLVKTWNVFTTTCGTSMCRMCWDLFLASCICLVATAHTLSYTLAWETWICAKTWKSNSVIWKDRDGSVLSYVRVSRQLQIALIGELELCNGYRDHCLKLLIAFGIGLTWSLSQVLMAQITSRTHLSDKLW